MVDPKFITGLHMDKEEGEIVRLIINHNPCLRAVVYNKVLFRIQRMYGNYPRDLLCIDTRFNPPDMRHCVVDYFKDYRDYLEKTYNVHIPRFDSFKELKMKYELYGMS